MIEIELRPDIEARLQAEAKARQIELPAYIESVLERAMANRTVVPRKRTRKEMRDFFEAMANNSEKIPQLPDDAFTRKSFYEGHDS
ncbi:MAG: hypothetical protein DMG60_21595 [Acidobacteria bacterium]|nr:MAG: hypothetical protein DMG60_21595 [Acidobacteriota bacterium]